MAGSATEKTGPKRTGAMQVYLGLRTKILEAALPPGSDLDEASLVREFGVSRTPVREAMIRLASEGLIEILPNRGGRVTPLTFTEIPAYFEALDLMQRAATRWAAVRRSAEDLGLMRAAQAEFTTMARRDEVLAMTEANHAFHACVADASGNDYICRTYMRLLDEGLRVARLSYAHDIRGVDERLEHHEVTIGEHGAMIEAIANNDCDAAEELAQVHTERFRQRIISYFTQNLATEVAVKPN